MRALWQRYGKPGIGVPEAGVEALVQELSGLDLSAFFDLAVRGTEDLPLEELLSQVGVGLCLRPAKDAKDSGGAVDQFSEPRARKDLGVRLREEVEPIVAQVLDGGAAQKAGLAAGDTLLALNGLRVTRGNLQKLLDRMPEETPVELHVFRRDELMRFSVPPQPAPADTCELRLLPNPDRVVEARRIAWLEGQTG
jgi:predicted metalloprotease with PDZ domain